MAISPSAIEIYQDCKRKYAGKYWGASFGWPRPEQGKGAGLGDEVHNIAEAYQLTGKQPDRLSEAGEIFISGLPYMAGPGSGGAEGEYDAKISGIEYTLKVDYRGPLPASAMFEGRHEPVDRVTLDYKTSVNPKEYGIWGREAFLRKPQPLIYGAADLIKSGDSKARLRWLYMWTKGKRQAKPSDATLTRAEIEDGFGKIIHPTAWEMVQLKKAKPDPNSVEPTPSACKNFGGCPFAEKKGGPCRLSKSDTIAGLFGISKKEDKMGLLDELKASVTPGLDVPSQPAPAAAPAAIVNLPPQSGGFSGGLLAALGGGTPTPAPAPAQVMQPAANPPALGQMVPAAGGLLAALGGAAPAPAPTNTGAVLTPADKVNPPEARAIIPSKPVASAPAVAQSAQLPSVSNGQSTFPYRIVFEELANAFSRMAARC